MVTKSKYMITHETDSWNHLECFGLRKFSSILLNEIKANQNCKQMKYVAYETLFNYINSILKAQELKI